MTIDDEVRIASSVSQSAWAEMYKARENWFTCLMAERRAENEYMKAAKSFNRAEDALKAIQRKGVA